MKEGRCDLDSLTHYHWVRISPWKLHLFRFHLLSQQTTPHGKEPADTNKHKNSQL